MKSIIPLLMLLSLLGFTRIAAAEADPTIPVRQLCDRLIDVMKQGGTLGFQDRENRLRPVIGSVYDMSAVTKSTLGLAANKLSADEISQLSDAYGRYSVATYADLFTAWHGEHFEVDAPRPLPNGNMVVPSWIIGGDGNRTGIDYLMHQTDGNWRIVDVLFNGSVSQVAVRRSEFVPIFRENGLAALINMLDSKSQALAKKGG